MYNKSILSVFPEAVIYSTVLNLDPHKILDFCKKSTFKYTVASLQKNPESNSFLSDSLNIFNELTDLKQQIEIHIKEYLYNILKYEMNFKILNSWITKVNPNGYSQAHVHTNTFLTGVYYPFGNKEFKIKFYKKNQSFFSFVSKEFNMFTTNSVTFDIVNDNTLLLFPSDLKHNIEKNKSNIERYSIAFNVNPKGFIGEGDSRVEF